LVAERGQHDASGEGGVPDVLIDADWDGSLLTIGEQQNDFERA
jgi:hypothetical protein